MKGSNIILIGMPGSSKTSVGKALAQKTDRLFIDADKRFEEQFGAISDFFAACGEAMFRVEEGKILYELSRRENTVIACGGGAVLNPAMNYLKDSGTVVFLSATVDTLRKRLAGDSTRPLLKGGDLKSRLLELWNARKDLYKKYADITLPTDTLSIDETVSEILRIRQQ